MENKQAYETPRLEEFGSIADRTLDRDRDYDGWKWKKIKKWKDKKDCEPRFSFFHSSCASS